MTILTDRETMVIYTDAANAVKEVYYGHDRQPKMVSEMIARGSILQTYTVAVGGYKLLITFADTLLISIRPKASSAGRGEIAIDPGAGTSMSFTVEAGPFWSVKYFWDTFGSYRLRAALQVAILAGLQSRGNKDDLYAMLGESGFCAICGASLTDELSMSRGIGPECFKKVYTDPALQYVQKKRVAKSKLAPASA